MKPFPAHQQLGHRRSNLLWLMMSAVIGILVYEAPRFQVKRSIRNSPSAQGEIVLALDDEGTVATFPTGESRLNWRAYTKY